MGASVALENVCQETVEIWPSKVEGVIEKKNTMTNQNPYFGLQAIVSLSTNQKNSYTCPASILSVQH
jgi:hypothetical protein